MERVDWGSLVSVIGILITIGMIIWVKDRKISAAEEAKRNADMDKISEANRLRDSMSLVERANEYWRRRGPGGKDPK